MIKDNTDADDLLGQVSPWLAQHVPQIGQPINLTKFSNGQSNPTYELVTERGQYVLRAQPTGVLLKSAHAVDREFQVMAALNGTAVPVPKMIVECRDTDVIGRKFFVMEKVAGNALFDARLADYTPADRARLYHKKPIFWRHWQCLTRLPLALRILANQLDILTANLSPGHGNIAPARPMIWTRWNS